MTVLGVIVLFIGMIIAGAGAGLALFERIPARGSLRLMGVGSILGIIGLAVTLFSADENEKLSGATYIPLGLVIAIVLYAAWFASRSDRAA
jgi:predicted membrane channel-forming protein YqfA (hemolysin III family)